MPDERSAHLAAVFGRTAQAYDSVIPFFTTFGQRLVDAADPQPGERVLDVACGRGATALPAAERVGPEGGVLAVDLAPEMAGALAADAAARGLAHVETAVMDAEDLDVPEASFDLVLCALTLMLLPHPHRAAGGFRDALRPGGRCAVSVFTGAGPGWDFYGELLREFAPRAARPLAPPPRMQFDAVETLTGAGFEAPEVTDDEAAFVFPDPDAWWAWVWTQGMRGQLEAFDDDVLDDFRRAAAERLEAQRRPEGIVLEQRARYVVARRP